MTEPQCQRSFASERKFLHHRNRRQVEEQCLYRFWDGIEAEHRKDEGGSWNQAQQNANARGWTLLANCLQSQTYLRGGV